MQHFVRRAIRLVVVSALSVLPLNSEIALAQIARVAENAQLIDLSWDGRYIALQSPAALLPGDTNGHRDVYVADRLTGALELASVSSSEAQADADCELVGFSADGSLVAFSARATNLTPDDPAATFPGNLYIRNRIAGTTTRVPTGAHDVSRRFSAMSPNGRYIGFSSKDSTIVPAGTAGAVGVFVHDLQTGTTRRVAELTALAYTLGALAPSFTFSHDGRYVAVTLGQQIDPRDNNTTRCVVDLIGYVNCPDVYVLDQTTGALELRGLTAAGTVSNHGAVAVSMSADGRFIAFLSESSDYDGIGGFGSFIGRYYRLFVEDRLLGTVTPFTAVPATIPGQGWGVGGMVSADGGRVVVTSGLDLLPDADTSGGLYAADVATAQIERLSNGLGGAPAPGSYLSGRVSGNGQVVAFISSASNLVPGDTNGTSDVFVRAVHDADADTLPDEWEQQFGLSTASAAGVSGSSGDPDGDGLTNEQELLSGSHPTNNTAATRYFAEGATGFFETRISIANPGASSASVTLQFLRGNGTTASQPVTVPGRQSRKVHVSTIPGMNDAEFSTLVQSNEPVIVDRQMWWDGPTAYGTSAERSLGAPSLTWYFAEGATHSGFDLFYLLQNPSDTAAEVDISYLRPADTVLRKSYIVPARSRFNIWLDVETFTDPYGSTHAGVLANADVSAVVEVTNGVPIIAERAMYLTTPGRLFDAGHESAGATAPALRWMFAEGATGAFFDTFLLLGNPSNASPAQVRATYLLPGGATLTKDYVVAASSRFNIWVDAEMFPDGQGGEHAALADTAVSATLDVLNGVPIVAERSMCGRALRQRHGRKPTMRSAAQRQGRGGDSLRAFCSVRRPTRKRSFWSRTPRQRPLASG